MYAYSVGDPNRLSIYTENCRQKIHENHKLWRLGIAFYVKVLMVLVSEKMSTTLLKSSVVDPIRIGSVFRSFVDPYSEYGSGSTHVNIRIG